MKRGTAVVDEYEYDVHGNRTEHLWIGGSATATYDSANRLTLYDGTSYEYTTAGDLQRRVLAGAVTTFEYDDFGNLRTVNMPGGMNVEYVVDGRSRRVGKKVNGALVRGWLYSGQPRIVAELDHDGALISRFVYGTRPNVPDYMLKDGVAYRIISDHLGSPRLVVNAATGTVVQRIDYDAFGVVISDTAPGFQPFGFAGGLYDTDTRLVRFGARDYDPYTGRWTTSEPLGFAGGDTNLYAYALSDPINWSDGNGLAVEQCRAVAQIPGNVFGLQHMWLRTSTKEAGLGQAGGGVPGEGDYRLP